MVNKFHLNVEAQNKEKILILKLSVKSCSYKSKLSIKVKFPMLKLLIKQEKFSILVILHVPNYSG
jgi:hypothetical protein